LSLSTGISCDDFLLGMGDSVYFLFNLTIWA
jgi:hypothetical protein